MRRNVPKSQQIARQSSSSWAFKSAQKISAETVAGNKSAPNDKIDDLRPPDHVSLSKLGGFLFCGPQFIFIEDHSSVQIIVFAKRKNGAFIFNLAIYNCVYQLEELGIQNSIIYDFHDHNLRTARIDSRPPAVGCVAG